MKVKIIITVLLCTALLLCSCKKDTDYLSYQSYPMEVKGTLTVDTLCCKVTLKMEEYGRGEIILDSPERLSGYRFSVDKEGVWVYYDDICIPLEEEGLGVGVSLLVDMFSCDSETLCEISSHKIGETEHTRVVYPKDGFSVAVYLKPNESVPTQIEAQKDDSCAIFAIDSISYR